MKYPLPAIVKVQTEWGPDAAGATSDDSPQGDAGGARRRPRLRFVGSSAAVPVPMLSRTPWPGTDGNQSCGCGDCGAGDENRGLRRSVVRVPRLTEDPGGRADEDKRAAAVPLHLPEKRARCEKRRGQVRVQRRAPALERQVPHRAVL